MESLKAGKSGALGLLENVSKRWDWYLKLY